MSLQPKTLEEVQAAIQAYPRLLPRGGGSKPALSTPPGDVPSLELAGLCGVLEYEPGEFTFTALAGTPVAEVEALLAEHGQYLPFDPPLAQRGATLGGTVAANVSGPGRHRYGGVRDFLIGVRFVDGQGRLVRGGGKVVKNSAGFDLPKLMVGSMGRLGTLVELSFKVFPGPEAYTTLKLAYPSLAASLADIYRLATSPLELYALDLEPAVQGQPGGVSSSFPETRNAKRETPFTLWARLGGLSEAMPARLTRLRDFLLAPTGGATGVEVIEATSEGALWQRVKAFEWVPAGWALVKIPLTPRRMPELEEQLKETAALRRYSAGGNLAWLAWPPESWGLEFDLAAQREPLSPTPNSKLLDALLTDLNLAGLALFGPPDQPLLGINPGQPFARRVKQALDPTNRFLN